MPIAWILACGICDNSSQPSGLTDQSKEWQLLPVSTQSDTYKPNVADRTFI